MIPVNSYINIHEHFLELKILNATYESDYISEALREALKAKIVYMVSRLQAMFNEMYNHYREGKLFPSTYDFHLQGFRSVLDNSTGLPCYQSEQWDMLKNEIRDRLKT